MPMRSSRFPARMYSLFHGEWLVVQKTIASLKWLQLRASGYGAQTGCSAFGKRARPPSRRVEPRDVKKSSSHTQCDLKSVPAWLRQ